MRIIITGPAASGKDELRKRFEAKGFTYAKPYTTRPKRNGETDSDYHFITEDEFLKLQETDCFLVTNIYNGWMYGIMRTDFVRCDVSVMTPEYISDIKRKHSDLLDTFMIILLMPDESVRMERLRMRNDADSVERRIAADRKQFENFTCYDVVITDPYF